MGLSSIVSEGFSLEDAEGSAERLARMQEELDEAWRKDEDGNEAFKRRSRALFQWTEVHGKIVKFL